MAKIFGLFGAMSGRLADSVMLVRNGKQIVRKYQPVVFNPSTAAQVAARAKMKLVSQLSTVMAPVIAIPRQGDVSSRNLFAKVNYKLATFANDSADIALESVQLTKSVVGLPYLSASREAGEITVELSRGDADIDRVVYAAFIKESDNKLRFLASSVVSAPGASFTFQASLNVQTFLPVTILAYGVRDNNDAARAFFGDLTVSAEDIAKVVTTRQLTNSDVTLTETRGINVASPQSNVQPSPAGGNGDETRSTKKK